MSLNTVDQPDGGGGTGSAYAEGAPTTAAVTTPLRQAPTSAIMARTDRRLSERPRDTDGITRAPMYRATDPIGPITILFHDRTNRFGNGAGDIGVS
ncbi:hypothetical protein GCM10027176_10090 [Actinoallomurus bryophytorum]